MQTTINKFARHNFSNNKAPYLGDKMAYQFGFLKMQFFLKKNAESLIMFIQVYEPALLEKIILYFLLSL